MKGFHVFFAKTLWKHFETGTNEEIFVMFVMKAFYRVFLGMLQKDLQAQMKFFFGKNTWNTGRNKRFPLGFL